MECPGARNFVIGSYLLISWISFIGGVAITGDYTGLTEGDTLTLKCASTDDVEWKHNGMRVTSGGRYEVTVSRGVSTLTVRNLEIRDGGRYECVSDEDYFDTEEVRFTVMEALNGAEATVRIVDPADKDSVTIHTGGTLILKCIGTSATSPTWDHNGMELSASTPGGRIIITDSVDINNGDRISLLSREDMSVHEKGRYSCGDRNDPFNTADIQVNVVDEGDQAVEIYEPVDSTHRVNPDHQLTIKCKANKDVQLAWKKDGQPLQDEVDDFIINAEVDSTQDMRTSMLTKQQAEEGDSGIYTCYSIDDDTYADQVNILVGENQEPNHYIGGPVPTKNTTVLMRVGSPLTLQCHLATGTGTSNQPQPEWKKDGHLLRSGSKYIISAQHDLMPSTLAISNTVGEDIGEYKCVFRHRDTGEVACVFIFVVKTMPCPPLFPPDHGAMLQCPLRPLYGDTCTFSCRPGHRLTHTHPLVCEKFDGGGGTYWSGPVPQCRRMSTDEVVAEVPFSLSHVLLRVGSLQTLQCNHAGTWSHNGQTIMTNHKYTIEHGSLVIKDTNKGDTGLYECNIHNSGNDVLVGIKKYNVTTLPCPRLLAPKNGHFHGCSSQPVYGETCHFRCDHGYKLTGSRARTCDLADSQTHVYWTGNIPMCKGSRYAKKHRYSGRTSAAIPSCLSNMPVIIMFLLTATALASL